jgi:hypothetical protein
MSALPGTDPVTDSLSAHDHVATRRIAGFTPRDLSVLVAFLLLTIWAIWATREVLELKERRIVSVSLSKIITDFVAAESRNGSSPETATARTRAYLAATDEAMRSLSQGGRTVLVSEAVVGNSVPDMTAAVAAAVNARLAQTPALTPQSAPVAPPPPASLGAGDGN